MLPKLYAILDVDLANARGLVPLTVLDEWLDAGVRLVQLRAKTIASGAALALADAALDRTRRAGARLILNDRADLAAMAGADGVHVGQDDLSPADVRSIVGPKMWVGLSTHTGRQLEKAVEEPVNYLAIGPIYPTNSKANPDPVVGLEGVRRAAITASRAGLPIVAIGGITLERVGDVIAAGATSVAVISDLLTGSVSARARAFLAALATSAAGPAS